MKVKSIIKENQPKEYKKLKQKKKQKQKLNEREIKELMQHDRYYRGRGGAIRQK